MLRSRLQLFVIVFLLLFSFTEIFSQNDNEAFVSIAELEAMADQANFQENIATAIYIGSKSTFFAIQVSDLSSRYVELRILEQVYLDKEIVHIGMSRDLDFILFLVNNKLSISNNDIVLKFNNYHTTALKEIKSMSKDQLANWLLAHDKSEKE